MFQVGLGLPLNSAVQGSRTIVFGSYDVLGRCIGVLVAWAGGALLLLAFHARRERMHGLAAAAAAAAAAKERRTSSGAGAGACNGAPGVGPILSDCGAKTAVASAAPAAAAAAAAATPPPQATLLTPVEVFGGGGEVVAAGAAAVAAPNSGVAGGCSAELLGDPADPFLVPLPLATAPNGEAVWVVPAGEEAWQAWPAQGPSDW